MRTLPKNNEISMHFVNKMHQNITLDPNIGITLSLTDWTCATQFCAKLRTTYSNGPRICKNIYFGVGGFVWVSANFPCSEDGGSEPQISGIWGLPQACDGDSEILTVKITSFTVITVKKKSMQNTFFWNLGLHDAWIYSIMRGPMMSGSLNIPT